MSVTEEIRAKLRAAFSPETLEIIDESEQHRGHGGYQEGGESHFRVVIAAAAFEKMTRIQQHRAIHNALGPDLIGQIHALAIQVKA